MYTEKQESKEVKKEDGRWGGEHTSSLRTQIKEMAEEALSIGEKAHTQVVLMITKRAIPTAAHLRASTSSVLIHEVLLHIIKRAIDATRVMRDRDRGTGKDTDRGRGRAKTKEIAEEALSIGEKAHTQVVLMITKRALTAPHLIAGTPIVLNHEVLLHNIKRALDATRMMRGRGSGRCWGSGRCSGSGNGRCRCRGSGSGNGRGSGSGK